MCLFDKDRRNFEDLYGFCVSSVKRQLNHQIVFCFTKKKSKREGSHTWFWQNKGRRVCVFLFCFVFSQWMV